MLYGSDSLSCVVESHKYKIHDLFNRSRSTIYQHPLSLILASSLPNSDSQAYLGRIRAAKTWRGCVFFELITPSLQKGVSSNTMRRGDSPIAVADRGT